MLMTTTIMVMTMTIMMMTMTIMMTTMTIMMTTMTIVMTKIMVMGLLPLCGVVRLDCGARAHLLLHRERVEGF